MADNTDPWLPEGMYGRNVHDAGPDDARRAALDRKRLEALLPAFDRVIDETRARNAVGAYLGTRAGNQAAAELVVLYYERAMLARLLDSPDTTPDDLRAALERRPAEPGQAAEPSAEPAREARVRFAAQLYREGLTWPAIRAESNRHSEWPPWDTESAVQKAVKQHLGDAYVKRPPGRRKRN